MKKQTTIRLILKSHDHIQLEKAVKEIIRVVKKTGSRVIGPVPLPNRKHIFTVLRSPNNDKKSREQFAFCAHKRLVIISIDQQEKEGGVKETMNALMKLQISSVVDVAIKN